MGSKNSKTPILHALHPVSLKFPQCCLRVTVPVFDWWWSFPALWRKIVEQLFLYLSPPGDWRCDVTGFVLTGTEVVSQALLQVTDGVMSLAVCSQAVSQAQPFITSQIKPLKMVAMPAYGVISPDYGMFRVKHLQPLETLKSVKVDTEHWQSRVLYSTFYIIIYIIASSLKWICEGAGICGLSLLEAIQYGGMCDHFHLHCHAGG